MADNNRDVELRLTAKTAGTEDIQKLAKELQDLAKQGGDAAPEFTKLAQEVAKIGQQISAVDNLAKLRAEVGQLGDEQKSAAAKSDEMKVSLYGLSKATAEAVAAQAREKQVLMDTRRALAEKRDEFEKLKAETADASKRESEYQSQARQLKLEILQAKQALRDKAEALGLAADEAKRAQAAEDALAKQYNAAAREARAANTALSERRTVLQQSDAALKASGVATEDLAQAQGKLVGELQDTVDAAQAYNEMVRDMAAQSAASENALKKLAEAEVEAARRAREMARDTKAALDTLGVEAFNPIEKEIGQVQAALDQLAKDATVSASTFERAYNTAGERIAVLRRELDGTAQAERDGIAGLKLLEAEQEAARLSAEKLAKAEAEFTNKLREADNIVRASAIAAELDKQEAAAKRAAEQAKATADAFNAIGLKNRAAIEAEIKRVESALDVLKTQANLTGGELDKAFSLGQGKITALKNELNGVQPPMERGAAGVKLFSGAMGQLAAVFGAYEAGQFVIKAVNDLEQMRRVLTLVTGSSEKAAQQIEFLRNTANQAGVEFGAISGGFAKLNASMLAAGVTMKTTNEVFASVTKSSGVLGQSSADTEASLRALGQMASKGKVSMEELGQQLGERMPAVLSVTAKSLGLTTAEMMKLMENGQLLADEEFFAAFARGVDKTFVEGAGKIQGMRAEWNRFVGALTEGIQVLSDGALGKAAGATLGAIGEMLKYLVFTASMVGESFTVMGQQIGVVVAALVTRDFGNLKTALADIQETSDAKMTAMVARMQGLQVATQDAGTAAVDTGVKTAAAGQQMQTAAAGAQANAIAVGQAATAAQANAAAQVASSAATAAGATVAQTSFASWAQLTNAYNAQIKTASDKARVTEDLNRAVKVEAESLVTIAKLTGDVTAQRQMELQAAQQTVNAEVTLRDSKVAQLDVLKQEVAAMEAYIAKNGDANGARTKEVAGIKDKITAMSAEIDRNNAAITSSQLVVTQRQAESAALADNSARVKEFGEAYTSAKTAAAAAGVELERVRVQFAAGKMSQDDLANATRNYVGAAQSAATASLQYRDSLSDATRAAQLYAQQVQSAANAKLAGLKVDQQGLEIAARVAAANGDERQALELTVQAKQKAIEVERASQQAKIDEANATTAALVQQRAEITGTDDLSNAKRAEIDLRIEAQRVKLIEAQGSDNVVRGIQNEITALRSKTTATNAATVANQKYAASQERMTSDGFKTNADGSAAGSFTSMGAMGSYYELLQKRDAGTLTADDKALYDKARAEYEANRQWIDSMQSVSAGSVSTRALSDLGGAELALNQLRDRFSGTPTTGRATTTAPAESTKTININLGGKTTTLTGLSTANANALTAMLRDLESSSTTAG